MQPQTAQIFVTKLAAARRLLRAAIRMYFHQEDALAIHAVTAAAYGVLKDLKAARGGSEAEFATETLMRGFLAMAKARVRGELPPEVLQDNYTIALLDGLISLLDIRPTTDINQIEFSVVLNAQANSEYWRATNRASNFLKHADRDADAALPLSAVDSYGLMMKAMFSYESIAPDDLGLEGTVLQVHFLASHDGPCAPEHPLAALVAKVRSMGAEERLAFSAFQLDRDRPSGID